MGIIRSLKRVSFFLFLIPFIAIVFSLLINNFLTTFSYEKQTIFYSLSNNLKTVDCEQSPEICKNWIDGKKKVDVLADCEKNIIEKKYTYNDEIYDYDKMDKLSISGKLKINNLSKIEFKRTKQVDITCIRNSNIFWFYNMFPFIAENIWDLKSNKNFSLGTSGMVNPFFYGETSISNIVKRFPLSFFFKPLMFISSVLMVVYWYLNNKVAKQILKTRRNFSFFIFGFLSAIFLFFHVVFLGSSIEHEIFKKLRRLIIVFFILFEIISQVLLVINLRKNFKQFNFIISEKILKIKYLLIVFMVLITILILTILSFFDLSSSFDYFLEWNYFVILLFFYLLSSLLWKYKTSPF